MEKFSRSDPMNHGVFPVARVGYPFILIAAFITAVFVLLGLFVFAAAGFAITAFFCFFFRDPKRVAPNHSGAVVSPADGRVIGIGSTDESPFFHEACMKISIFMSVFNVHVNRIPFKGRVKRIRYNPGKFFVASRDKASEKNEQNAILLETATGIRLCFVQIAGLVARRIICRIQEGDSVARGQRFGMICFGSRLDVYLPADANPNVAVGNRVKAGTTILGYLK
jgi:phosphatidylserine decarboxylase